MRIYYRAVALGLVAGLLGCESTAPLATVSVAVGPHHGIMIRLPEDSGFVELVNEPEVSDRRDPEPTAIVAYYLQSDAKSPMTPGPSDVSVALQAGRGKAADGKKAAAGAIPLATEPKPDDPSGGSRFASKPGPYELATIRGTLSAKIGGQEVAVPFGGGR